MFKDPQTSWDGPFPYDILAPAGITPDSSMEEVKEASFDLMSRGLMTPEVRVAWDQLRNKQKRMLVDWFLYHFDPHEQREQMQAAIERQLAELAEPPDVIDRMKVAPVDLLRIEEDFREIPMPPAEVNFIQEFASGPPLPDPGFIQFDL